MASHLVDVDGQPSAPVPQSTQRAVQQAPPQSRRSAAANTNGVVVGESGSKNVRSGPGTDYSVKHIAYPGDHVRIVGSGSDKGGYPWYRVYFPSSGAEGWIGAQLIAADDD